MAFFSYQGLQPVIDQQAYIHENATIIGNVIVEANCFIGAQAVLRGDFGRIEVRKGANIQETCVVHSFPDERVVIGENAHIGHGAILHGCTLAPNCLIGMNAVIMDGAQIGENAMIGALSFVKENCKIKASMLAFGNPVKEIRALSREEIAWKRNGTELYQEMVMARQTKRCEPLRPPPEPITPASSQKSPPRAQLGHQPKKGAFKPRS